MPSRAVTRPYLKGEPDFEIRSAGCGESTQLPSIRCSVEWRYRSQAAIQAEIAERARSREALQAEVGFPSPRAPHIPRPRRISQIVRLYPLKASQMGMWK
jgi:hypothetical protein